MAMGKTWHGDIKHMALRPIKEAAHGKHTWHEGPSLGQAHGGKGGLAHTFQGSSQHKGAPLKLKTRQLSLSLFFSSCGQVDTPSLSLTWCTCGPNLVQKWGHLLQAFNAPLALHRWAKVTFSDQHFLIGSPLHLGSTTIILFLIFVEVALTRWTPIVISLGFSFVHA